MTTNPEIDGVFDAYCGNEKCNNYVHPCCSKEMKSMTLKQIQDYDYFCSPKCRKIAQKAELSKKRKKA